MFKVAKLQLYPTKDTLHDPIEFIELNHNAYRRFSKDMKLVDIVDDLIIFDYNDFDHHLVTSILRSETNDLYVEFTQRASEKLDSHTLEYIAHHIWCHLVSVDPNSEFCIYKDGKAPNDENITVDTEVDTIFYSDWMLWANVIHALCNILIHSEDIFYFCELATSFRYDKHILKRLTEANSEFIEEYRKSLKQGEMG